MSIIGGLLSVCECRYADLLRLLLVSLTSYILPAQTSAHWHVLLSCLILSKSHLTWLLPSSFCACVSPISCGNLNLPSPNLYAWVCSLAFQWSLSTIWSCVNYAIQGYDRKLEDVCFNTSLEVVGGLMLWANELNHTVSDEDEIIQEHSGRCA